MYSRKANTSFHHVYSCQGCKSWMVILLLQYNLYSFTVVSVMRKRMTMTILIAHRQENHRSRKRNFQKMNSTERFCCLMFIIIVNCWNWL